MDEILNVQAHDSEILCLEFSKGDTGENSCVQYVILCRAVTCWIRELNVFNLGHLCQTEETGCADVCITN